MERFIQDLAFGARLLIKNKGFSITAILTLGVCIAANAAVFSIVNAVVLRSLPFPEADRLVVVHNSYPKAGADRIGCAVPDYYDRVREVPALGEIGIFRGEGQTIGGAGDAERISALQATPSLLRLLRVRPVRGRVFSKEEGEIGHHQQAILSYALWQRRFGGRDDVVGRTLRVNGEQRTIVGVLPADFRFALAEDEPLLVVPAAFTNEQKSDDSRHSNNYQMIARLKPGATITQAQQQVDALNKRNLDRFPEFRDLVVNVGFHTVVYPLQDDVVREVSSALYMLWAGAGFVLLIGMVNAANLVLVRATSRLKELATRHVLGAGPGRLARQLLTETTLLTVIGGVLGLLLGYWTLNAIRTLGLERLPRAGEIGLDGATVLFTVGISALLGLFLGVVPVLSIRRSNLAQAFREEGRSTTGGRRARVIRTAFVTAQVALALMLLVGAGLLLTSFRRLLAVDPGFKTDHVVTARVALPAQYKDRPALGAFAERTLEGLRALPGVQAASMSGSIPFGNEFNVSVIFAEGYVMQPGESVVAPLQARVSDGYFEALRMRLVRGRLFDRRDTFTSPLVTIVDERLARKFWPNTDPIGKRMFTPDNPKDMTKPGPNARFFTVIGIVPEVRNTGLAPSDTIEPVGACYFPASQQPGRNWFLVARTGQDPSTVVAGMRKVVAGIDPELPVYDVQTLQQRLDRSLETRRTPMLLALAFALVALFLAAVGVYGVLAYQVTQRTREIGIRMALGSEVRTIFTLVLRDGMTMVGAGVAIGLGGALAMSRGLQSQLFGVGSLDPSVISLVVVLLAVVALVACAVPALRASRVSPVIALTDQ
ncbi:MAG: ABC transporter permease [Bacteroidales bacterium]